MTTHGAVWQVFDRFRDSCATRVSREGVVFAIEERTSGSVDAGEVSDPIVHLLRNAMDHGIEQPAERIAREAGSRTTTLRRCATAQRWRSR